MTVAVNKMMKNLAKRTMYFEEYFEVGVLKFHYLMFNYKKSTF